MTDSIDQILGTNESEPQEALQEGRENDVAAQEAPQEPVTPTGDGLPSDVFKGLKAEREKRQAAEARLKEYEERLSIYEGGYEEPEPEYEQQSYAPDLSQVAFVARAQTSELLARQKYEDFDQVKDVYLKLERTNPLLAAQAEKQTDPWDWAYKTAKNQQALDGLGTSSIDEMRAAIRAELMAELQGQQQAAPVTAPKTLLNNRSVGQRTGPAWTGPRSIEDILKT
jgi:hypothetical protein